jgi:DnaJ family protein C protein 28
MDKWEPLIDRLIRESMDRGEFDNLPGAGQPIDLTENPYEQPELRTVHRLLRNAGFAPAWIEERKDIDGELQRAYLTVGRAKKLYCKTPDDSANPDWLRAMKEFRERVDELNQRIRFYNLKAPSAQLQRNLIDADQLLRKL